MTDKNAPDYDALVRVLKSHVRKNIIGPHRVPTGSSLSFAIDAVATLSVMAGFPGMTPEELRKSLADHVELLQDALDSAFSVDAGEVHPEILFSLLDSAKSLILRNQLARRRLRHLDGQKEAFLLTGTKHFFAKSYFDSVGNPGVAICSFYLKRSGEVWAIIAFDGASPDVGHIRLKFVDQDRASDFSATLTEYCRSLNRHQPDFHTLSGILNVFGPPLMQAFARANFPKHIIFIPHRLLHVIPFHALYVDVVERQTGKHQQRIHLHDIAKSISYASSMVELQYAGQVEGAEEMRQSMKPIGFLAVLDTHARDLRYIDFERKHYEAISTLDPAVELVTEFRDIPSDLRHYRNINWSSHASSSPVSWAGSYLSFDGHRIAARTIAEDWNLLVGPLATLGACETSIDLSASEGLDEYCGLDLAFRLAGARATYGTLWPVADAVAALASIIPVGWAREPRVSSAEALTSFERALRTGDWRKLNTDEQIAQAPTPLQESMKEEREILRHIPSDAFETIEHWGAFRCFGEALRSA